MDFDKNKSVKYFLWHYFNMHRADSGWLRFFIVIFLVSLAGLVFRYGFLLISQGVKGEFELLVQNFTGITLYLTSISPGVLFVIAGILIIICGLPSSFKNLSGRLKS